MLNSNPDLINSCRVCRSPNQDGDYECLYVTTSKHEEPLVLSEAGILYENLLDVSLNSCHNYPQFLCNSCDLQMKLFKKLKDKAYKTLEYLQNLYEVVAKEELFEDIEELKENNEQQTTKHLEKEQEETPECNELETEELQNYKDVVKEELMGIIEEQLEDQEYDNLDKLETYEAVTQEQLGDDIQEQEQLESHENNQIEELENSEIFEHLDECINQQSDNRLNKYQQDISAKEYPENNINEYPVPAANGEEYLENRATIDNSESEYNQNEIIDYPTSGYQSNPEELYIEDKSNQGKEHMENESFNNEKLLELDSENTTTKKAFTDTSNSLANQINVHFSPTNSEVRYSFSTEVVNETNASEGQAINISENKETFFNSTTNMEANAQGHTINVNTNQFDFEINIPISHLNYQTNEQINSNTQNCDNISPDTLALIQPVIDKNDYVTEIYEMLEDDESKTESYTENNENILEYDVDDFMEEDAESTSALSDVDYVIEEILSEELDMENPRPQKIRRLNNGSRKKNISSTSKKREYKCEPCQLQFKNSQEAKQHRTDVHDDKYPCKDCLKTFKSLPSLYLHMKTHNGPAFQCEICQKTFNQRAHYQYHMNYHNNVRNFKCTKCDKAFLSKTDLKTHARFHTKKRAYVCQVCGKDYLMMEHLKAHQITHTGQTFPCEICNQKFTTPKTLRQHVKTIHEDEPKFKCDFCTKTFRRKHHLQYHLRLHQKNVKFLDNSFQAIDDFTADDLIDQELVDDPGFVALNEDSI